MTGTFPPLLDGPRLAPASGKPARQLVVILHGYGADGLDLIDLGRAWQGQLPDAAFVAPNAPEHLPFEALGGGNGLRSRSAIPMNTASVRRPPNRCSTGFWTTNWPAIRWTATRWHWSASAREP